MKNPWKAKSKVNPQTKDGHRRIASKVLQELLKQGMTGSEWAVCMAVIDKTYGFQKLFDCISYGQLEEMTGFKRQTIIDAVKSLELRHILVVNHNRLVNHRRLVNEILFNKHYDTWVVNHGRLVNRSRLPQSTIDDYPSQPQMTNSSQPQLTHKRKKETLTKETLTKERLSRNPDIKKFIDHYHDKFLDRFNEKPMIDGGKDGKIIKTLLGTYDLEILKEFLDRFFDSTDPFILQGGYTIGVFKSQINKLIAGLKVDPKTASRYITIKEWEPKNEK